MHELSLFSIAYSSFFFTIEDRTKKSLYIKLIFFNVIDNYCVHRMLYRTRNVNKTTKLYTSAFYFLSFVSFNYNHFNIENSFVI